MDGEEPQTLLVETRVIKRRLTGPRKLETAPMDHGHRRRTLWMSLVQGLGFCGEKEGIVNKNKRKRGDKCLGRTYPVVRRVRPTIVMSRPTLAVTVCLLNSSLSRRSRCTSTDGIWNLNEAWGGKSRTM